MSLQEEIESRLNQADEREEIEWPTTYIINKVLDAALDAGAELIDPQGYVPYWKLRDAINKLRGPKGEI